MKAQLSIFLIVGIVLVMSVLILIYVVASAQPADPTPQVDGDNATLRTCLSRISDLALTALRDGAITTDEAGPLPPGNHYYLTNESPETLLLGRNNYTGLCARTGPNAINDPDTPYSCPQATYARPGTISIQEQLRVRMTTQLRECTGIQEDAEVIIQPDALVVQFAGAQHKEGVPLTSTWAAIAHVLREEVTNSSYEPPVTVNGCTRCQDVEVTKNVHTQYDSYNFSVNGRLITSIKAQNRPLILEVDGNAAYRTELKDYDCGASCTFSVYSPDGEEPTTEPSLDDLKAPVETNIISKNPERGLYEYDIFTCVPLDFNITTARGDLIEVKNLKGVAC